jgi:hypothetical protein
MVGQQAAPSRGAHISTSQACRWKGQATGRAVYQGISPPFKGITIKIAEFTMEIPLKLPLRLIGSVADSIRMLARIACIKIDASG